VSDYAGLLPPAERSRLEERLAGIEAATSNQFLVAIFPSLEGDSLEDFSIRLAEKWKAGMKGKDNGLIILLVPGERKARIEVGYGLEGAIPDVVAGRIIREVMGPRFREGAYAAGLAAAVDALDAASRGEFTADPPRRRSSPVPAAFIVILFLMVVMAFVAHARSSGYHVLGPQGHRRHGGPFFPGGFSGGGGSFDGFGGGGFGGGGGGGFGGGGASGSW
jgi:uncharacterized protein